MELIITGKGPSIRYSNAIATRRIVWLFPTFLAAHPVLARILHDVTGLPSSKWHLRAGPDVALDVFCAAVKANRPLENIGLVSRIQKVQEVCQPSMYQQSRFFGVGEEVLPRGGRSIYS